MSVPYQARQASQSWELRERLDILLVSLPGIMDVARVLWHVHRAGNKNGAFRLSA